MAKKEAPAVGIDLGTTYSRLGVWKDATYSRLGVWMDGKVEIISNEQSNRTTPSCVAFVNHGCLIGEEALNQAHRNPTNTIFDVKRLIGRRFSDKSVQSNRKHWPFTIVAGEADKPSIVVNDMGGQKHFSAEEISSRVLLQMKEMASTSVGFPVTKAVVTVPVYFNNSQREATKHACAIAGLEVLQILDEPTAATLAYRHHNKDRIARGIKTILVFDLGGGKLDVSLIKLNKHGADKVIATSGDSHLGGQDFDNQMVQFLLKTIQEKHNHDLSKDCGCIMRLKASCERAKRMLSFQPITVVEAFYRGEDLSTTFTQDQFAELNKDLFGKCVGHVKQCLEDAKVEKDSIDEVVLVGGSTRIPKLQQMLRSFFEGKDLYKSITVDEAVAYGASIQAAILNGSIRPAPACKIKVNCRTRTDANGILTVTARKEDDDEEKGVTITMSLDEIASMIRDGRTNELYDKVRKSALVTIAKIQDMTRKAQLPKGEEDRHAAQVEDAQGKAFRELPSEQVEEGKTGEREEDALTKAPPSVQNNVKLAIKSTNLIKRWPWKGNKGSTIGGPSREKGGDERKPPEKKEDGEWHAIGLGGGRSKEKAEEDHGPAIGIDLGTTYTRVAVVMDERVRIIEDDQGNKSMRSCVAFHKHERHIGEDDELRAAFNPTNTIFDAKRFLGRRLSEETIQRCRKLWPFKVVAGEDDRPVVVVQHEGEKKRFHAEEISSMILSRMKEVAENFLRHPVSKAVVTVPAYFNDAQREATKVASAVAGLKVVRLLNDTSAAALAYGLRNEGVCRDGITRLVLIFHLGGGTCDVSIVELDGQGALKVRAAAGDTHLGGEDLNNRLMEHFIDHKNDTQGSEDIRANPVALRRLKAECEKAKKVLSHSEAATVCVSSILPGIDLYERISRAEFQELNMDLFQRCFELVQQCLDEAKVDKNIIHDVVLVGGSTIIPMIQEKMKDFFNGKVPCCSIHATESVADGAALLAGSTNHLVLVDVTRLSLRIETAGGDVIAEVPRNTPIPFTVEKAYTDPDYASIVRLTVYEGEGGLTEEKKILCRFEMHGLESKPRVTIHINEDGTLMISARIAADKSSMLPRREMDRMIDDAQRYKRLGELNPLMADSLVTK